MTAQEIEIQALALSKARDKAVNAADALQEIAEDEAMPADRRAEALRLRIGAAELARALWADRQRVRALGASCQDAPAFGPTRPPPPPPPGAVAEPSCVVCRGEGTVASDQPFMMMAAVPCGACEGRGQR